MGVSFKLDHLDKLKIQNFTLRDVRTFIKMNDTLLISDILVFLYYVKENDQWALTQFFLGSCLGLLILVFAIWIDFGFICRFFERLICGRKNFQTQGPKKVPPSPLDLNQIEDDDSLE